MTFNETNLPTVQYTLVLDVSGDDDDVELVEFVVEDIVLPRVGDQLSFEVPGSAFAAEVAGVEHRFTPATENIDAVRELFVTALVHPVSTKIAQQLLNPAVLEEWLAQLPFAEPVPNN